MGEGDDFRSGTDPLPGGAGLSDDEPGAGRQTGEPMPRRVATSSSPPVPCLKDDAGSPVGSEDPATDLEADRWGDRVSTITCPPNRPGKVAFNGKSYPWHIWGTVVKPDQDVESWGIYDDQFYKGTSAILHRGSGQGQCDLCRCLVGQVGAGIRSLAPRLWQGSSASCPSICRPMSSSTTGRACGWRSITPTRWSTCRPARARSCCWGSANCRRQVSAFGGSELPQPGPVPEP